MSDVHISGGQSSNSFRRGVATHEGQGEAQRKAAEAIGTVKRPLITAARKRAEEAAQYIKRHQS